MNETYPKIIIKSQQDLQNLLAWRDNNKDLVRRYNPVLENAIIQFDKHIQIYFKTIQGYKINFKCYYLFGEKKELYLDFDWRLITHMVDVHEYNGEQKDLQETIQDAITIRASLMAYMLHYKEVKERVHKTSTVTTKTTIKKKRKGNNKKSVRKIGTTIYNVSFPNESNEKREYERHSSGWLVRGFWRTYKNGKRVWVKPHVRGTDKAKIDPPVYEL